ncbi:type VII secretion integral membrane protein EccD [Corynebacterium sp.]|uniref:type VII secretion integral membrane protein EccD n=1 Tax=Corynebacterium sp. TaxID=1720 RepID=UPI0026DC6B9D|nr:type VII secretion integral membrane protein EccD [Corynebacterium sp.]MDO5031275.1 type VII secretion integral membrane protein EccD [Corynebacterium sp.]
MSATLAHSVRVTVRIRAHDIRKEADVSLPLSSSLGEVLEELFLLVDVPSSPIPWRATTAAGKTIPLTVPLERTPVAEGSVLLLAPKEKPPAPVIRDAAEALAEDSLVSSATSLRGLAMLWGCAGVLAATALLAAALPLALALPMSTVIALGLAVWTRHPSALVLVYVGAAASGWCIVGPRGTEAALGIAAACLGVVGMSLLSHALRLGSLRGVAAALSWCVLLLCAASGYALNTLGPAGARAPLTAGAAALLACTVILLACAPALSTRAAGIRVPRLPTAGQDLAVSDEPDAQPESSTRCASRSAACYEGIALGIACAAVPALCFLGVGSILVEGFSGAGFVQALCLCVAGAVVIHSVRHARHRAAWALGAVAVTAACAVAGIAAQTWRQLAAAGHSPGLSAWILTAVAVAVIAGMLAGALWAPRLGSVEPTVIVWWERAESLAIAASLPLAAHIVGVFMMIRGLG